MWEHSVKSFLEKPDAPSNIISDNAARNTREEEKSTAKEVAAAEVAAPSTKILRAPDDASLFLPVVPIRDC